MSPLMLTVAVFSAYATPAETTGSALPAISPVFFLGVLLLTLTLTLFTAAILVSAPLVMEPEAPSVMLEVLVLLA